VEIFARRPLAFSLAMFTFTEAFTVASQLQSISIGHADATDPDGPTGNALA